MNTEQVIATYPASHNISPREIHSIISGQTEATQEQMIWLGTLINQIKQELHKTTQDLKNKGISTVQFRTLSHLVNITEFLVESHIDAFDHD